MSKKNSPISADLSQKTLPIILFLCNSLSIEKFAVVVSVKDLLSPNTGCFFNERSMEMTKGEASILDTEVVVFPMQFNENTPETVQFSETVEVVEVENHLIKTDFKIRFARLKKSLRKRSVSIL